MKSVYWNNIVFQDINSFMKRDLKKSLALKVKALRESASLTQEELADKCDVSWRTISNLERGVVVPDLCMLIKIAEIFQVKLDDMVNLNIVTNKSWSRLEREQFLIEKIKLANDNIVDYLLDQLILLLKYFN
ncbi:MAG: helix-turn-helix transcriptional regulator [Alphaproteobacteria bacterium]|nr:helix-turn-helix transcriptional regulator [Alphaproteobacteria bacterium]